MGPPIPVHRDLDGAPANHYLTMMLSKDDVRDRAVKICGKQLMVTNAECSPESRQLLSSLYGYTSVMV